MFWNTVHPHTRGEYGGLVCVSCRACGSPPHAWGIPRPSLRELARLRFTPTRVGNTTRPSARVRMRSVHPHTRGEYVSSPSQDRFACGSPPHAWGIRLHTLLPHFVNRFTPTRVG